MKQKIDSQNIATKKKCQQVAFAKGFQPLKFNFIS